MSRALVDSDIKWLGKIPKDWKIKKIKNVLNERNEMNKDGKEDFILSLTIADGVIPYNDKKPGGNKAKEDITKYKIAKKNDIIINSMNVVVGAAGLSNYNGIISPVYYAFYEKNKISNSKYYYYLFLNKTYQDHLFGMGNGIMVKMSDESGKMNTIRKKIPIDKLKCDFVPYPNVEEQTKIANYLDKKCKKIDSAIEYNQKAIVLLEEYKKTVFKNVINDYEITNYKLKYLVSKKLQYGANSSGVTYDQNLPRYVRITDIEDDELKNTDILSLSEKDAYDFILNDGDILFARSGSTVGKSFLYKSKYGRCAFAGYLIRAQFKANSISQYVYNYTNSDLYVDWKDSIFIQSTIQNIGADKYSNMIIPIPNDISKVKRINQKINSCTQKINEIIFYRKQILEKLEEYKKSLIYEVVTGKKEV